MMKSLLLLTLTLVIGLTARAQNSNLIFFTEQGERFSVVLNGVLQNLQPETNIKVTDLPAPSYKLKVIFENKNIPELDKTLFFNQGSETSFAIRKNKQNEYVVRYFNEIPIEEAPAPIPTQAVIIYHPEPINTTTTTTTSTTTISNPAMPGIGINMSDHESGTNVNVNLNMGGIGAQTTTTTTTTTVQSSEGYPDDQRSDHRDDYRRDDDHRGDYRDDRGQRHENDRREEHRYVLPGYTGIYGCPFPMSPSEFNLAKESIRSKTFEDSKLTIAKQIINSNCLLCSQVKEIMLLFTFESTRLDLAKYAYGHTLDIGNYYKVNDAFTYESSIDELNDYISGFRR